MGQLRADDLSSRGAQHGEAAGGSRPRGRAYVALGVQNTDGTRFSVTRGVTRPVWEPDAPRSELFGLAREVAAESAGASNTARRGRFGRQLHRSRGLPSLDGLGLLGAGYHTLEEHIE